jgi:hypothetical protein
MTANMNQLYERPKDIKIKGHHKSLARNIQQLKVGLYTRTIEKDNGNHGDIRSSSIIPGATFDVSKTTQML